MFYHEHKCVLQVCYELKKKHYIMSSCAPNCVPSKNGLLSAYSYRKLHSTGSSSKRRWKPTNRFLTRKPLLLHNALNYGVSFLFSIIQKNVVWSFFPVCRSVSQRPTLQPTSTPLGPRGLEPGAALAKIQGSHQASQIPRASPALGRNLPQVDSCHYISEADF